MNVYRALCRVVKSYRVFYRNGGYAKNSQDNFPMQEAMPLTGDTFGHNVTVPARC